MRPELERLKTEDITDEELARFKTRAKADLIRSLDSNEGLAENLANYHTLFGDWRELFRYVDRLDALTKADVRKAATATFVDANRTVGQDRDGDCDRRALGSLAMSRLHRFAILSAVAALAVAAAAPPAVAQVTKPSEIVYPPLPAFQAPKPTRFVLPNGMVVMVIEDHELPLVNVTARIRTGSLLEPAEKIGLAGLVGTVLRSGGTTTRKPDALDEFLEARAASIESGMSADSASASMSALKADAPAIMEAFADVLRNPAFDPDRLKIALTAVNASIARQNDNPQGIVQREFAKTIQGADSPFGRTTTYASIGAVTRDDLLAWHKKYFHPNRIDRRRRRRHHRRRGARARHQGLRRLGRRGRRWPTPGRCRAPTPQPGVFEAVKADSTQSFVAVGHQGELLRTSPDYVPVTVMNEVLAGGFTSRLFGKIRTELGLAYSVGGSVNSNWTRVAPFQMQMSTRADATVKAIEALIDEAKAARPRRSRPPTPS